MREQIELGHADDTLRDRMAAKGINMDWYDKSKKLNTKNPGPPSLNEDRCCILSIYLLDVGGKLHTTNSDGKAYMMVRIIKTKPKEQLYLCAHCRLQFKTYKEAKKHYD
jgi:hypothetical protein